jgi:hypothetical protein
VALTLKHAQNRTQLGQTKAGRKQVAKTEHGHANLLAFTVDMLNSIGGQLGFDSLGISS